MLVGGKVGGRQQKEAKGEETQERGEMDEKSKGLRREGTWYKFSKQCIVVDKTQKP